MKGSKTGRKINTKWHAHTTTQSETDEIKALVFEARQVLERLDVILEGKIGSAYKEMRKTSNFSDPAWTHKMADQLGYCRALDEIKTLITIKHTEE